MFTLEIDDQIELSLIGQDTAPEMFEMIQRERDYLLQWLAWPVHTNSLNDYMGYVKRVGHDYAEGKGMACCILYMGKPVGAIGFNYINYSLKKTEIGYWLSKQYQGEGIMTRACLKLIEIAFTELGMEKIEIPAAVGNKPSRAVCERLGMKLEGIITNAENLNGRIVDHAYYGLRKTET